MEDIHIKVEPDAMRKQAGEIKTLITDIRGEYEALKGIAYATPTYWNGEASDSFRRYVKSVEKDMQEVLKRLSEHPDDLLKMAGIYEEGEKEIVEYSSSLPVDVIQ